jgi:hypothetical protein
MKIINLKYCPLESNEVPSRSEYKNKIKEVDCYEIKTIEQLEEFIKNPPFSMDRKINDFIKFQHKDINYLLDLINVDDKFTKQMVTKKIFSKIFKYKSKTMLEYWLCRGWNIEDATEKIKILQSNIAKNSHIKNNKKDRYNTTVEFWMKRGFSKDESIKKIKERQSTFSLKKCIEKYGNEKGIKIFNKRQLKWKESLYNDKSDVEIKKMYSDRIKDGVFGASKESLKVFLPLIEKLKNKNLLNEGEYHIGYNDKKEFMLYDKDKKVVYFYDFVIPKYNLIIEFNGTLWHPNGDNWKPANFVKETKDSLIQKEVRKMLIAEQNNFKILKIWDVDDIDININKCLEFVLINLNN